VKSVGYILRLTLVLFLITAVVAGLLGCVNYLTKGPIAENTAKKAQQAMQDVLPADSYEPLELTKKNRDGGITEAYVCEDGYIVRLNASGFGGSIDMMVGIDNEGKIAGVSVIGHAETASLGSNCTRPEWQAQFLGSDAPLAVTKDGGTIDALTGATVTSRGVTEAVNLAMAFVKEVQG